MTDEMTEFEKMRAGLPYRNPDAELMDRLAQAAVMNRIASSGPIHSIRVVREAADRFEGPFAGKRGAAGDLVTLARKRRQLVSRYRGGRR